MLLQVWFVPLRSQSSASHSKKLILPRKFSTWPLYHELGCRIFPKNAIIKKLSKCLNSCISVTTGLLSFFEVSSENIGMMTAISQQNHSFDPLFWNSGSPKCAIKIDSCRDSKLFDFYKLDVFAESLNAQLKLYFKERFQKIRQGVLWNQF